MFLYTTTQVMISNLLVSTISNCYRYPLTQTVNFSKLLQLLHPLSCIHRINFSKPSEPLHPPSCPHTVNFSKPSQKLHPPSCPHTVNSSKPLQPLHPPSCPHTINSNKPSQPLHPPSCPHTVKSSKPLQPLHPPFCPHIINSSKPPQPLLPPSFHHTSQQIHTTSFSHTSCQFTNQQPHDQCSFFLSHQHRLIQKWTASNSRKTNTKHKQISSVPFKPCSWLRKATQIANDLCKYKASSNNYCNAINQNILLFHWPT